MDECNKLFIRKFLLDNKVPGLKLTIEGGLQGLQLL